MHSFLNRIKLPSPSKAKSAQAGSSSEAPRLDSSTADDYSEDPHDPASTSNDKYPFLGLQKIHPDLDALVGKKGPASPSTQGSQSPTKRRFSADELGVWKKPAKASSKDSPLSVPGQTNAAGSTSANPPPSAFHQPPLTPEKSRSSSLSGFPVWSTFGRGKDQQSTPTAKGVVTGVNLSRASSLSRPTTGATRTPNTKSSAVSRPESVAPHSPNDITLGTTGNISLQESNSEDTNTHDSPSTFGNLSPPNHSKEHTSSPPSPVTKRIPFPLDADGTGTYPPRTSKFGTTFTFPSLPFTFGRQARSGRPTAEELFSAPIEPTPRHNTPPKEMSLSEEVPTRRPGVEWISRQALSGGKKDWPAKISEELVRLSIASTGTDSPGHSNSHHQETGDGKTPSTMEHRASGSGGRFSYFGDSLSHHGVPSLVTDHSMATQDSLSSKPWQPAVSLGELNLFGPVTQAQSIEDQKRRRTGSTSSRRSSGLGKRSGKDRIVPLTTPTTVYSASIDPVRPSQLINFPPPIVEPVASTEDAPALTSRPQTPSGLQLLTPPTLSVTAPTPRPSPARSDKPDGPNHNEGLRLPQGERPRVLSVKVVGKRKAEDQDESSDQVGDSVLIRPRPGPRIPSSYQRKRARLSTATDESDVTVPRSTKFGSMRGAPSVRSAAASSTGHGKRGTSESRNQSQVSIPLSAYLTPRAQSIHHPGSIRNHDPLKNRNVREKRWAWAETWVLDRNDMPLQAWLFLCGFLIPPCWWIGALLPVRKETDQDGKGSWVSGLGARQKLERLWRLRCLFATIISTVIYVPIIVIAVIFAKRR